MYKKQLLTTALLLVTTFNALSAPTKPLITSLIAASEAARGPEASPQDIDQFLAFLSDDFVDYHPLYGMSFEGKAPLKKGLIEKGKSMVRVEETIESITLGRNTAFVVVNEDSEYYKKGNLKQYQGRTLLVLEFDQNDLITAMRRYTDQ